MENRTKLNVTGVEDVESFDEKRDHHEHKARATSSCAGTGLHIGRISLDVGQLASRAA